MNYWRVLVTYATPDGEDMLLTDAMPRVNAELYLLWLGDAAPVEGHRAIRGRLMGPFAPCAYHKEGRASCAGGKL